MYVCEGGGLAVTAHGHLGLLPCHLRSALSVLNVCSTSLGTSQCVEINGHIQVVKESGLLKLTSRRFVLLQLRKGLPVCQS